MKFKYLLILLSLCTIVSISGCIQEVKNVVKCEPNWILVPSIGLLGEEYCKSSCYNAYKVNSYKIEEIPYYDCTCISLKGSSEKTDNPFNHYFNNREDCLNECKQTYESENQKVINVSLRKMYSDFQCYCDVNNCNPK